MKSMLKNYVLISFLLVSYSCWSADRVQVWDSVVRIEVKKNDGSKSLGSGFIFDKKGLLFTNFHVVKDMEKITSVYHYKNNYEYAAKDIEVRCVNRLYDVAVLEIESMRDAADVSHVDIADFYTGARENDNADNVKPVKYKDKSVRLAYHTLVSNRLPKSVTINEYGKIGKLYRLGDIQPGANENYGVYLMNHETGPGSSGSPVYSDDGELIAMLAGGVKEVDVFAIPAHYLVDVKESKACKQPDKSKTEDELSKNFESKFYQELFKKYSAKLNSYEENILLRGQVLDKFSKASLSGVSVKLLKRTGAGFKDVGLVSKTDNNGIFEFNDVASTVNDDWYVEINHDQYVLPEGGVKLSAHTLNNNVSVVDNSLKNLVLRADPKKIELSADAGKRSAEFEVVVKKKRDGVVTDEIDRRIFRWRLCKDTMDFVSCEAADIPGWFTIDQSGRNNSKYEVEYREGHSDSIGVRRKRYRIDFVRTDVGSRGTSYDELKVKNVDDLVVNNSVEDLEGKKVAKFDVVIMDENYQVFPEKIPLKVVAISEKSRSLVGYPHKAIERQVRSTGIEKYELSIDDGLDLSEIKIEYEPVDHERYVFIKGGNESKKISVGLNSLHTLVVRKK